MSLRIVYFGILLFGCVNISAQNKICATIDKYDPENQLESSHNAIIQINQTVLERIIWFDGESVDSSFFGRPVFYGETSTFNDSQGARYRITQGAEEEGCFENLREQPCKALLPNSFRCKTKTESQTGFCWKH